MIVGMQPQRAHGLAAAQPGIASAAWCLSGVRGQKFLQRIGAEVVFKDRLPRQLRHDLVPLPLDAKLLGRLFQRRDIGDDAVDHPLAARVFDLAAAVHHPQQGAVFFADAVLGMILGPLGEAFRHRGQRGRQVRRVHSAHRRAAAHLHKLVVGIAQHLAQLVVDVKVGVFVVVQAAFHAAGGGAGDHLDLRRFLFKREAQAFVFRPAHRLAAVRAHPRGQTRRRDVPMDDLWAVLPRRVHQGQTAVVPLRRVHDLQIKAAGHHTKSLSAAADLQVQARQGARAYFVPVAGEETLQLGIAVRGPLFVHPGPDHRPAVERLQGGAAVLFAEPPPQGLLRPGENVLKRLHAATSFYFHSHYKLSYHFFPAEDTTPQNFLFFCPPCKKKPIFMKNFRLKS